MQQSGKRALDTISRRPISRLISVPVNPTLDVKRCQVPGFETRHHPA
ncbi:putative rhs1 protein [Burkholderia thailandensis]|uniref:Rhs1 protein n=1 Tax=Burkholderia thailandensis TaxID=57975 RepID=A0AAW9CLG4_BURTH|nr:putative rhs1 protein [Burkholderia thailandensis]MDW9251007.1 putative rhs1 protein [Burkholderia thailandensis]